MRNSFILMTFICLAWFHCRANTTQFNGFQEEIHCMISSTPGHVQMLLSDPDAFFPKCTLSITGTGYMEGVGYMKLSFSSTKKSCSDAARELKALVLEFQLRVS